MNINDEIRRKDAPHFHVLDPAHLFETGLQATKVDAQDVGWEILTDDRLQLFGIEFFTAIKRDRMQIEFVGCICINEHGEHERDHEKECAEFSKHL